MLKKSLNTSVHVSFQNPVKTPVKVMPSVNNDDNHVDNVNNNFESFHNSHKLRAGGIRCLSLLSQVKMDGAKVSFLHVSQNVPTDSPMEVTNIKYFLYWSQQNIVSVNFVKFSCLIPI